MTLPVLPVEVEDIIYKYHHQMKYNAVMEELKYVTKTLIQKCGLCESTFISFNHIECCHGDVCDNIICRFCVYDEYESNKSYYQNEHRKINEFKYDEDEQIEILDIVTLHMECNYCILIKEQTEFYDMSDSDFEEQEEYGFYGGW